MDLSKLVGGSGSTSVNSVIYMNLEAHRYTNDAGEEFLKSGWLEDDIGAYPKAKSFNIIGDYTGVSNNQHTGAASICYDGTFVWVLITTSNRVNQCNPITGAPTGIFFSVGSYTRAICWDKDNNCFWTVRRDNNDQYSGHKVYKLSASGAATGYSFEIETDGSEAKYSGIEWDGQFLHLVATNFSNFFSRFVYTTGGVKVGRGFAPGANYSLSLCYDGESMWMTGQDKSVYQRHLLPDFVYSGVYKTFTSESTTPIDVCFTSQNFWMLAGTTIYKYTVDQRIGLPVISRLNGCPQYLRIK